MEVNSVNAADEHVSGIRHRRSLLNVTEMSVIDKHWNVPESERRFITGQHAAVAAAARKPTAIFHRL